MLCLMFDLCLYYAITNSLDADISGQVCRSQCQRIYFQHTTAHIVEEGNNFILKYAAGDA